MCSGQCMCVGGWVGVTACLSAFVSVCAFVSESSKQVSVYVPKHVHECAR